MWIFCGGMTRAGSTLQFQLAAHLVERAGLGARVEWAPPEDFPSLKEKYVGQPGWKVWKTHSCTDDVVAEFRANNARGVYIFRDVRDVIVSQMRKHELSFDAVSEQGILSAILDNFGRWTTVGGVLVSCYEDMVEDVPEEVARIAAHLEIAVSPEETEQIASQYTVERQRNRIREAKTAGSLRRTEDGGGVYDPVSNLHLDHFFSGQSGEWRSALAPEQVALIEDRAGDWLVANGYQLSASAGCLYCCSSQMPAPAKAAAVAVTSAAAAGGS